MGDDATSAESALFSPRRSRPAEQAENRSWRTNSFASHVGSVALVFLPPESTAHTEDCRTSERSSALGECSPISTGWRFFVQRERRPSAANKTGDDAFSRESGPFSLRWSRRHRVGNTNIGEDAARTGHFGSIGIASPPRPYPCRRATSDVREQAKRSRGFYGVAMSTFEERGRSGRKT